jgi:hypothetical protein
MMSPSICGQMAKVANTTGRLRYNEAVADSLALTRYDGRW